MRKWERGEGRYVGESREGQRTERREETREEKDYIRERKR